MKIITQLVILTLSLLLVSATKYNEYCTELLEQCNVNYTTKCAHQQYLIKSCCDLRVFSAPSGVYTLRTDEFDSVRVYCDMDTDKGGWNVIQRNRKNSPVSFNRNWAHYNKGFGDLEAEFWYGLNGVSCLTQSGQWEMRIDIQNNDKTWTYYHYNIFSVGSDNDGYPLTIGGYTLKSTDYFETLNGMKFSTPDVDNDKHSSYHCAKTYASGWWYYYHCTTININRQPPFIASDVLFSEMKIRPINCVNS